MATENMDIRVRAIDDASSTLRRIGASTEAASSKMSRIGQGMSRAGRAMTVGLTLPLVAIGTNAIKTAADFEKAMLTMGAVADVPAADLERLGDLAKDMGAKTVFSANEAADAMVELAKAGIKPAEIEAGALANTLDLASAGDLDLAQAATIAARAMNTFNLSGEESKQAVDALAGAANASSADVDDMAMALAQGGLAASAAGLSIQETTATLAAFADAGMQGSDAGTSLKTFLLNLVPTTARAKEAMDDLGLSFTDANGEILPMTEIAGRLQGAMQGLTQAEQQTALKTIFGTDAFRAANVVVREGAKGLEKYMVETSEVGTAADVAAAKNAGLSGTIETLKGSFETLQLAIGERLAPMFTSLAKSLTGFINSLAEAPAWIQKLAVGFAAIVAAAGPVLYIVGKVMTTFKALPGVFQTAITGAVRQFAPLYVAIRGIPLAIGEIKDAANTDFVGVLDRAAQGIEAFSGIKMPDINGINDTADAFSQVTTAVRDGEMPVDEALAQLDAMEEKYGGLPEGIREYVESTGAAVAESKLLAVQTEQANATLDRQRGVVEKTMTVQEQFGRRLSDNGNLFAAMGTTLSAFSNQAAEALQTDKWEEFSKAVREDAIAALQDFHDAAFESLNFVRGKLDELEGTANLTAQKILEGFRQAGRQTRRFGANISEVARIGGGAGHDLAQALLESGDVMTAMTIANAPAKIQEQIVGSFNKGEGAATSLADKLTRQLVGVLSQIEDLLTRIAGHWGITVTANTAQAEAELAGFRQSIANTVNAAGGLGGGIQLGGGGGRVNTPRPGSSSAHGGITLGPQVRLVGERGPEGIMPLDQMLALAGGGGGKKIDISIDRRRWVDNSDYETRYRGF